MSKQYDRYGREVDGIVITISELQKHTLGFLKEIGETKAVISEIRREFKEREIDYSSYSKGAFTHERASVFPRLFGLTSYGGAGKYFFEFNDYLSEYGLGIEPYNDYISCIFRC